MLLVTFRDDDPTRIGALDRQNDEVVDLSRAADGLPRSLLELIAAGDTALETVRRAVESGAGRRPLTGLTLLAPIPRPARNILCIGKNYREHAHEVQSLPAGGGKVEDIVPVHPIVFTKAANTVIGPGETIPGHLDPTESVDYEGELAVVIGTGGRGISQADAMRHVYGYTILNDVTSRRLQRRHQQWFIGKSLDGFCPMGPALLTADAVPEVGELRVRTRVNGEPRQDGLLADLIFDIPCLIETLSATMTLEPGDIIATGTPAGVGMGFKPPRFLQSGDVVTVNIEPIGTLENPVG
ncbi:MAG: fumarylacetoacetate hydrolase family protein [Gammaproteobacteria bacterium]|jgi:2-keto-4-pentenoate hydratase/2-oxohepta-3-ene-1,7-dioic acid hydratase in catechol pathway|nr:fumarylacetoacetate hydrolase family protein [Gammaproteobacteria bacterium]